MKKKCLLALLTLFILSGLVLSIFPCLARADDLQQGKLKDSGSGKNLCLRISNRTISKLYQLKGRIQNSKLSNEQKNEALAKIDTELKWWEAKKQDISKAKSTSDLQKIGKDLKTKRQQYKKNIVKLRKERQKNKTQSPKTNESFI